MSFRRVLVALAFVCIFIVALIAFAPASQLGDAIEDLSGGSLSLAQPTGSVWHGSGVLLLRQKGRYQTLGNYRWDTQFFNATLQVQAGEFTPMTVHYVPFSGRITIDNLHLSLPASALESISPQLVPYQFQGTFDARSEHLIFDSTGVSGNITVDWLQAASGLSQIRPLGDYRIVLQGSGYGLEGQLSTLCGKLQLVGQGGLNAASGMRFTGTAQASPEAATELYELLHHIGPEISPGVFKLELMAPPSNQ